MYVVCVYVFVSECCVYIHTHIHLCVCVYIHTLENEKVKVNPIQSVMSSSFQTHGLYSPWNSPGQNTGVGSLSLLQQIFPNPGIELGSPALHADSLLSHHGSPIYTLNSL